MNEILKPSVKDYFEPLKNLHKREYPLPKRELKAIIESTMEGLINTNKRLGKMEKTGNLTEEERVRADSFNFYCRTLIENKISSVSIHSNFKDYDKEMNTKTSYVSDIAFGGYTGWYGIFENEYYKVPKLEWNNFGSYFEIGEYLNEGRLREHIKDSLFEKYENSLLEKFGKGKLLRGDIRFASDEVKIHLSIIYDEIRQGLINSKPSKEAIERAKVELADNNRLRYIDSNGNEIRVNKTRYEAWEEFKQGNQLIVQRLTELVNEPLISKMYPYHKSGHTQNADKVLEQEYFSLADKALLLLRVKGFSMYPDLTG